MSEADKQELKLTLGWINLFVGIFNLYLYTVGDYFFNLGVGSLNIWVFVWAKWGFKQ